jgi:hypothetical protein
MEGRTGGKTVYPPPPLGSRGMKIFCARVFVLNVNEYDISLGFYRITAGRLK